MKKNTLSVVVSAFNEEKKIAECLESAKDIADEIIVVNSSSTDSTQEIAKKYTKKVFTQENNLMLNINKNFGFSKATSDWILSLDADERVTPELVKEIKEILASDQENDGFWIPRKNIIFGKWIEHAGWYPDHQLRLFKMEKGEFPQKHVHEMVHVEGKVGYLRQPLFHINFESIQQFILKHATIYAPNEADQLLEKGYMFKWQDAVRMPASEFLSRFFARQGYKDGLHGLVLSLLMAWYHLLIFLYIWEKEKFSQVDSQSFLQDTEEEFKKTGKDITHWVKNEKTQGKTNPISKLISKFT